MNFVLIGKEMYSSTEEQTQKVKRRVLMASPVGTSIVGKLGDILRIGKSSFSI